MKKNIYSDGCEGFCGVGLIVDWVNYAGLSFDLSRKILLLQCCVWKEGCGEVLVTTTSSSTKLAQK